MFAHYNISDGAPLQSVKSSKQLQYERNLLIPAKYILCWQAAIEGSLRMAELEVAQEQFGMSSNQQW